MKENYRLCIGCNKLYVKDRLINLKVSDGKIFVNPETYMFGRSAYLCYNIDCILAAKKNKKLEKSFKRKILINSNFWSTLNKVLENGSGKTSFVFEEVEGKL